MITVFKNIRDSKTPHYVEPILIFNYIKNGRYKKQIEFLRVLEDKKDRDKLKADLPSVCWSGEFTRRANDAVTKHSGLVCIDFDHLKNVDRFKDRICKDQYTHMAFVSPSGDGLKVLVKIPPSVNTHADSCRALTDYFNEETLDEFRDIARVCYISFDDKAFLNKDSKIFTKLLADQKTHVFYPKERVSDTNEIYDRIIKWIDKVETYSDGNKHKYLVKLSSACLRFGIPEFECASRLYFNYANKASKVSQGDIDKIVKAVYGNYSHSSCTAHFEQSGDPIFTITKKTFTHNDVVVDLNEKDIIYLDNVRESMYEGFKTGKARGLTTYIPMWDNHWTWRKKELTFVGGIGNMGKTIMINNLCMLRAINDGWKFAIFSPEQDPPDDFYNDLIHTYMGKSTEPHHANQMTEDEYKNAMMFVEQHFFYIYPESESPTPDYINDCFEFAIKKHNVDVVIIDPFNQLDNDWRKYGRDDLYISEFLSKCKRFSQRHDVAYMIAGHPKGNLQKNEGNYEMPMVYDYAGGAMWNNKCDNILCYHRPFASTEPLNTTCMFSSQKIKKRKLTGVPGDLSMQFDPLTNRFIQIDGVNPFLETDIKMTVNPDQFIEPIQREAPF